MENMVTSKDLSRVYAGKKVFITGHTGYKGGWLAAWLHKLGAIVKGFALPPEYEGGVFNLIEPLNVLESDLGDIRDKSSITASLVEFNPDFVFHLAAQPLVRRSYEIPVETFDTNIIGTANLLEAVRLLPGQCSVVVVTTDKVYSNIEQNVLYKESDPLGGFDPYSASKACAELIVSSYRSSFFPTGQFISHKKSLVTARAGNVIGGGDFSRDRIIPDIVRALESGKEVVIRNPGSVRPWQHVLEPLSGYLLLAATIQQNPGQFSPAYNFGPSEDGHLTVKELVEQALKIWGSGKWLESVTNESYHEAGLLKLDITKAGKELHWLPKLSAGQAIEWTIEWYKKPTAEKLAFTFEQINEYMLL
jgi:CDP-glucose 4,6-dehydratase